MTADSWLVVGLVIAAYLLGRYQHRITPPLTRLLDRIGGHRG